MTLIARKTTGFTDLPTLIPDALMTRLEAQLAANVLAGTGPQDIQGMINAAIDSYVP